MKRQLVFACHVMLSKCTFAKTSAACYHVSITRNLQNISYYSQASWRQIIPIQFRYTLQAFNSIITKPFLTDWLSHYLLSCKQRLRIWEFIKQNKAYSGFFCSKLFKLKATSANHTVQWKYNLQHFTLEEARNECRRPYFIAVQLQENKHFSTAIFNCFPLIRIATQEKIKKQDFIEPFRFCKRASGTLICTHLKRQEQSEMKRNRFFYFANLNVIEVICSQIQSIARERRKRGRRKSNKRNPPCDYVYRLGFNFARQFYHPGAANDSHGIRHAPGWWFDLNNRRVSLKLGSLAMN